MSQDTFVGIDISQQWLDVYLHPQDKYYRVTNDMSGYAELVNSLGAHSIERIVVEATGRLEYPVARFLECAGLPVVIANPLWIRNFARATGILAKTDRLDAKVIARYGHGTRPELRPIKPETIQKLSELLSYRQAVVDTQTAEKNRLKRSFSPEIVQAIKEHLVFLQGKVKQLDQQIRVVIQGDAGLKEKDRLLQTIPGIGPQLSAMFLANLDELGKISRGKLASLVGVCPRNRDSGRFKGKRSLYGGRALLRRTLYMGTVTAIRFNPLVKAHFEVLSQRSMPFKKAMVPCMRKLLFIANAVIQTKTPWFNPLEQTV